MILIILSCFTIGEVVELQVPCKTVYHGLSTWSTTRYGDLKIIGITKPRRGLQSPKKGDKSANCAACSRERLISALPTSCGPIWPRK